MLPPVSASLGEGAGSFPHTHSPSSGQEHEHPTATYNPAWDEPSPLHPSGKKKGLGFGRSPQVLLLNKAKAQLPCFCASTPQHLLGPRAEFSDRLES